MYLAKGEPDAAVTIQAANVTKVPVGPSQILDVVVLRALPVVARAVNREGSRTRLGKSLWVASVRMQA